MNLISIYISGKITGLEESEVKKLFNEAEELLYLNSCYIITNPLKIAHDHDLTWTSYMLKDIEALFECQAIFMLSNWQDSKGARIEHAIATEMGMTIIYEDEYRKMIEKPVSNSVTENGAIHERLNPLVSSTTGA